MNQAYVIATSTKVDISGLKVPKKFNDDYFRRPRKVKKAQDDFCAKAEAGLWEDIADQSYPENLQWEMLVDVLRGRVKVCRRSLRGPFSLILDSRSQTTVMKR